MKSLNIFIFLIFSLGICSQISYKYDNLSRLIQLTNTNGSVVKYTYDELGNRSTKVITTASYAITASASPVAGGTVAGSGSFSSGQSCALTATPNIGYAFSNWTEGGTVVSTNASYTFTVSAARTLVANFVQSTVNYTINLSASPTAGGATTGGGTYASGASRTVTATPNTGYTFTNWTENGTVVSATASYTFNLTANRTLVANFAQNTYAVAANANPTAGGTVTGAGSYNYGSTCTLTASPTTGYVFTNWTENGVIVSSNSTLSFTVTAARNLVANFNSNVYTLSLSSITFSLTSEINNSGTITITSNTAWSASSNQAWLTVSPASGSNNGTLTLTANSANTATTARTATVTVSGTGVTAQTITVTQIGTALPDISTGLVAYYPFNGNANDISGNNNNGVDLTGVTFVTGKDGQAAKFGGYSSPGQIRVPNSTSLQFTTGASFVYWVRLDDAAGMDGYGRNVANGNHCVFAKDSDGAGIYNNMGYTNKNALYTYLAASSNGGGISTKAQGVSNYTVGNWIHVAFVSNDVASSVFVNGVKDSTINKPINYNISNSRDMYIGKYYFHWYPLNGALDEFRIYNRGLSDNEVLLLYNNSLGIYSISTNSNPAAGGTTTGSGSVQHGTSRTVTATANTGYTFTNWTENGTVVSTNASYTFTVTANRTLVANFAANNYSIATSSNPTAGGTTTGSGSVQHGTSRTVTATPNTGYTFTNWTENGTVVSTNANYTFTVTANRTLVANFTINSYNIAVSSNPTAGGTTTGSGSVQHGTSRTVTATANTGYTFTNWTENGTVVSTNASYTFTVTANRTLIANFAANNYTITTSSNPTAGGTTTGSGSVQHGTSRTVTATANTGYTFTNWTEGGTVVSTNASYTFTVTANRTLVANFAANNYTITTSANPTAGGTTTGSGSVQHGTSRTVTATPNTGYTFTNWTENGTVVSTNASYTFTVTANRTLVANFAANNYTITTSSNPTAGGTTTGSGSVQQGTSRNVTATANIGYTFTNWTENGTVVSTNASYIFTVTANRTLIANFAANNYTITTSSNPTAGGTTTGSGSVQHGTSRTVTATPNTGYTFTNWTENGTVVSTNASYTFTVSANRTLVANFAVSSYQITTSVFPINSGIVNGAGSYAYGTSINLTATANSGYEFFNWTENNIEESKSSLFNFTVVKNRAFVANFITATSVSKVNDYGVNVFSYNKKAIIIGALGWNIRVIDLSGRTLMIKDSNSNRFEIEIPMPGLYLIFLSNNENAFSEKVIIK